jgi:oxygen-independent coproporphyrinogen-3 oxidase
VTNLYWGGGTPTRLTPEQITRVHQTLSRVVDLSHVVEHTAECSPETVTADHLEAFTRAGLNRISVGAQSFDPQILRRMGRAHSTEQISEAMRLFRNAGIKNFNLDLITGFPEQSADSSIDSIQRAIDEQVPHLSLYMFREFAEELVSVRQVTRGHREQRSREERAAGYYAAKQALEAAGYDEYVVGYFAKRPEFRFDGEDYYFALRGDSFGFGAGGNSLIGRCFLKTGNPSRYGDAQIRSFIADPLAMHAFPLAVLPPSFYTIGTFKAFATRDGLRFDRFEDQFGMDFHALRDRMPKLREWFSEREREGAVFVETADHIALSRETWVSTMMFRQ